LLGSKPKLKRRKLMTKVELIESMAKDAKISKAAAGVALDFFTTNVTKALKTRRQGNSDRIRYFLKSSP